jgi:hypothetical protein
MFVTTRRARRQISSGWDVVCVFAVPFGTHHQTPRSTSNAVKTRETPLWARLYKR